MLTLEEIQEALKDRRIDIIAEATGLHRNTISKIRDRQDVNPSYRAMKAISDYLTA